MKWNGRSVSFRVYKAVTSGPGTAKRRESAVCRWVKCCSRPHPRLIWDMCWMKLELISLLCLGYFPNEPFQGQMCSRARSACIVYTVEYITLVKTRPISRHTLQFITQISNSPSNGIGVSWSTSGIRPYDSCVYPNFEVWRAYPYAKVIKFLSREKGYFGHVVFLHLIIVKLSTSTRHPNAPSTV